ncbi:MAPEG family protein [Shewanella waksmanii]|uniref:MAPEG family protein n=1 Tax=Shewanella waksmanii TaxID=213783 RepID=UPI003736250D
MDWLAPYNMTVIVIGATGLLFFIQLIVADIIGIRRKHTPGTQINEGHDSLLFRSGRAFANSNETVGIFVLFTLFAIFSAASPSWVNGFAVMYLLGRVAHMLFYYANIKVLRSVSFAVSASGLLAIFMTGLVVWV